MESILIVYQNYNHKAGFLMMISCLLVNSILKKQNLQDFITKNKKVIMS